MQKRALARSVRQGCLQPFRQQPVAIHGQPFTLRFSAAAMAFDAGIGEGFGKQQVAGLGEAAKCDADGMLGAQRDENLFGRDRETMARDPSRAGRPMVRHAAMGLIVQQRADATFARQLAQCPPEKRGAGVGRRKGQTELDPLVRL